MGITWETEAPKPEGTVVASLKTALEPAAAAAAVQVAAVQVAAVQVAAVHNAAVVVAHALGRSLGQRFVHFPCRSCYHTQQRIVFLRP